MKLFPRIVLTVAGAAAVVAGLIVVGEQLREGLRDQHYLAINEIDCEPPPGRSRERFLSEVHYYGQLPERLNALDADLPERLKTAFTKHPLVERVDKVTLSAPNRVRVKLVFMPRDRK